MKNYYVITRGFGDNTYHIKEFKNHYNSEAAIDYASEHEKIYREAYEGDDYALNCYYSKITQEL